MKRSITILLFLLFGYLINNNILYGQEIYISDGGIVNLNTDYSVNISSAGYTGILNLNANLNLSSTIYNFYGIAKIGNGYTVNLLSANSTSCNIDLSNSYTSTTTLVKKNSMFVVTGENGASQSIVMGDYSVLDLTSSDNSGKLIANYNLYMDGYGANAPKIKFKPSAIDGTMGTPGHEKFIEITNGKILTTDASNSQIHMDRNIEVDLSSVPTTGLVHGNTYYFTLATGSAIFYSTGTPNVIGHGGYWTNFGTLSTNMGGGRYSFGISATYTAKFRNNNNQYFATLSGLLSSGYTSGQVQYMIGDYNLTAEVTLPGDLILDIGSYTFSHTNSPIILTSGSALELKNSTGTFNGQIRYGTSTNELHILTGTNLLGANFSVSATSSESGEIIIGDGVNSVSQALKVSQFNSRVYLVRVYGNATYTVSPESGKGVEEIKQDIKTISTE
ncbi:MAG: hypothetical protein V1773_13450 [bacterium]